MWGSGDKMDVGVAEGEMESRTVLKPGPGAGASGSGEGRRHRLGLPQAAPHSRPASARAGWSLAVARPPMPVPAETIASPAVLRGSSVQEYLRRLR